MAAHTLVVAESSPTDADGFSELESVNPAMGNVAVAAYDAMLAAAAFIRTGATNASVTKAVKRVAGAYCVRALAWCECTR